MPGKYDEWDLKQARWRGETLQALKNINKDISDLKSDVGKLMSWRLKILGAAAVCAIILSILIRVIPLDKVIKALN